MPGEEERSQGGDRREVDIYNPSCLNVVLNERVKKKMHKGLHEDLSA